MGFLERMKKRWGVGPLGVIGILAAFSLAGMSVVRVKNPVLDFLLPEHTAPWVRVVVYILILMPIYQVFLFAYGTLFGQFKFFWNRWKMIGRFLAGRSRRADA